ncbi:MAG: hypothetical protein ABFD79_15410, partial [Phycisphaerales bacterium]
YYSFDPQARSVVVGPVALRAKGKNVPHTLEYSGSTKIRNKIIHIAARPYMGPALAVNKSRMAAVWKNSVHK